MGLSGISPAAQAVHADVAQLVEHHLAKVRVAGSSPVIRSQSGIHTIPLGVVGWPRGEAAACKAVYTGSNPVPTSGDWRRGSALPSHGRGHWFDPSIAHHSSRILVIRLFVYARCSQGFVPLLVLGALLASGLKDTTCWCCGDFSAFWYGKTGIEGGGSQLEGWTQRVGCVVTCRLAGAGQSTVMGELSWAAIRQARGVPPALDVRSGAGSVRLVDAESRCVLMTWPVAQWCPAWWPAHPRA